MKKLIPFIFLAFSLFLLPLASTAQEKSLYWDRMDVNISVLPNSDIRVEEIWEVTFQGGPFRYG